MKDFFCYWKIPKINRCFEIYHQVCHKCQVLELITTEYFKQCKLTKHLYNIHGYYS